LVRPGPKQQSGFQAHVSSLTNLTLSEALGINHGIVFTAWGVGGFVMGRLSQMLFAKTRSYTSSFVTAGVFLVIGAGPRRGLRTGANAPRGALGFASLQATAFPSSLKVSEGRRSSSSANAERSSSPFGALGSASRTMAFRKRTCPLPISPTSFPLFLSFVFMFLPLLL
jgi:hypothetical protein